MLYSSKLLLVLVKPVEHTLFLRLYFALFFNYSLHPQLNLLLLFLQLLNLFKVLLVLAFLFLQCIVCLILRYLGSFHLPLGHHLQLLVFHREFVELGLFLVKPHPVLNKVRCTKSMVSSSIYTMIRVINTVLPVSNYPKIKKGKLGVPIPLRKQTDKQLLRRKKKRCTIDG